MTYLLDTHAFLWAVVSPSNLGSACARIVRDQANDVGVSVVSFWEISLKYSLGKLVLTGLAPEDMPALATELGLGIEELNSIDAATFHRLPKTEHKDPFDRMLVWQCLRQGGTLLSRDIGLRQYEQMGLRLVW